MDKQRECSMDDRVDGLVSGEAWLEANGVGDGNDFYSLSLSAFQVGYEAACVAKQDEVERLKEQIRHMQTVIEGGFYGNVEKFCTGVNAALAADKEG